LKNNKDRNRYPQAISIYFQFNNSNLLDKKIVTIVVLLFGEEVEGRYLHEKSGWNGLS
jgi:hypothetical protein